jgi:hypothetical protein
MTAKKNGYVVRKSWVKENMLKTCAYTGEYQGGMEHFGLEQEP